MIHVQVDVGFRGAKSSTVVCSIRKSDYVEAIRNEIAVYHNIGTYRRDLEFRGKRLDRDCEVATCGIEEGSELKLLPSELKTMMIVRIRVGDDEQWVIEFFPRVTAGEVIEKIERTRFPPPKCKCLYWQRSPNEYVLLDVARSLCEQGVSPDRCQQLLYANAVPATGREVVQAELVPGFDCEVASESEMNRETVGKLDQTMCDVIGENAEVVDGGRGEWMVGCRNVSFGRIVHVLRRVGRRLGGMFGFKADIKRD
jgi:hypothetical protein